MEKYKKFFITTVLLILILIILLSGIVYTLGELIIGKKHICYMVSQVIDKWYEQKKTMANELTEKGHKIIILSGSNALFSIDSLKLKKETNLPVLNYSNHGGLCSYVFFDAKRILKPNDTVILPLEYVYYDDSFEIDCLNSVVLPYIIGYDGEYYKQLPIYSKFKVLKFMFSKAFYEKMRIGNQKIGDIYAYMLDKNGNIIENVKPKKDFEKINNKIDISIINISENYKRWALYEFIEWCKSNNIKVYAMAPTIYHDKKISDKEKDAIKRIKKFYADLNVEFLGEPQDSFYEAKDMYDTNYHLNYSGREKRTEYLIKLLEENNIK